MPQYHVTTFGCQMNEHDSERMKGMLESLGYRESADAEQADLILFNTCSIREKADERFVAHLHNAKAVKRRRPDVLIGVGGCWAQSVKDQVFRQFPFVDVAFGPGQVHKLAEFLTSDSLTAQGYFDFEEFAGRLPMKRARDFQGWVQISAGCNMVCSFCIVPSTRGREVSRPLEEIVTEVERLAADGVREVTLLGQNVNSYGTRLRPQPRRFSELLARVDAIEGIERIRYTSPHPAHMGEDVVRAHAELETVCEHIHLPLQSGSSPVLKRMRRTYTRERYLDRVALIREHVPDCALTSARSGSSGALSRSSSRVLRAPTRPACAAARATTRSSTSTASPSRAILSTCTSRRRRARRSPASSRCCCAPSSAEPAAHHQPVLALAGDREPAAPVQPKSGIAR